ncbi:MAG TPA: hypothetical protein VEI97_15155, partial [bacterium]|nr:hypothetical protein [bacterium]
MKIVLLVLLALVPYLLLPQFSLPSVRDLARAQQEQALESAGLALATQLGNQARRIQDSLQGILEA